MWFFVVSLCVLHVWSIERKSKWLFYLSKATPVMLMATMAYSNASSTDSYALFIAIGLLVSAIGDLFLMHPKDKFLSGLTCFLLAHLLYSYAFFGQADDHFTCWLPMVLAAIGITVYLLLLPTLSSMRVPVAVYTVAILIMAWGAIEVWLDVQNPFAACAALGASIFIVSDVVLAIDRFRSSSAFSRHVIMITYYSAQLLLTLSTFKVNF